MTRYLRISDGTTTINLDDPTVDGIMLNAFGANMAGWKNGGIKQDSPISDDSKLVHRQFDAISDLAVVTIVGQSQDLMITKWRVLLGMLEKAAKYWLDRYNNTPVYLIAKGDTETTTRYALIYGYKIDELPNLYGEGFEIGANANGITYASALVSVKIGIDHSKWSPLVPGASTAVNVSSTYTWSMESWGVISTLPTGHMDGMIQTASGKILTADDTAGDSFISTDGGTTWGVYATPPAVVTSYYIQLVSGKIIAIPSIGGGNCQKSTDDGLIWSNSGVSPVSPTSPPFLTSTGKILLGGSNAVYTSSDESETWNTVAVANRTFYSFCQSGNTIFAGVSNPIYSICIMKSIDDGATWVDVPSPSYYGGCMMVTSSGNIICGSYQNILLSTDGGLNWSSVYTVGAQIYHGTMLGNVPYLSSGEYTYKSNDEGITWELVYTGPGGSRTYYMLATAGGRIIFTNGDIYGSNLYGTNTMGTSSNGVGNSHVANKGVSSNLTHIFVDDGGVFGSNLLPMSAFPVTFLPAVPAVNDAVYFIVDPAINDTGPFDNLVFDIATPVSSTTSYTILWEYVSAVGAGPGFALTWSTLAAQDGTNLDGGALSYSGVNSLHWSRTQAPAWIPTGSGSINGIANCWAIRARVSALTGTLTPPTQQNRNIYSCVLPYVDIADTEIKGDLSALAKIQAKNQSDKDLSSSPDLYANRLILGSREYDRGNNFSAYINLADEQNPFGISVATGDNVVFATDIAAPTGRNMTYTAAIGDTTFANRAVVTFGPTIARDYYGRFKLFMRARQMDGTAGDIETRVQVKTSSGGILYTTSTVPFTVTESIELLYFNIISIPASAYLGYNELGDSATISVQMKNSSGIERTIYLYDLILMPADEWILDAIDENDSATGAIGNASVIKRYLEADSITIPKVPIRALVRLDDANNLVVSSWKPVCGGQAELKSSKDLRLWFLAAMRNGSSWVSPPEICHSVKAYKAERYLSMIGNP